MVHEISEVDDLASALTPAPNNVVAATSSLVGAAAADVSDAAVMDVVSIQIASPADTKVEVTKEGESLNFGIPDDGGDENEEEEEKGAAEGGGEDEEDNVYLNDDGDDEDEDEDDDDEEEDFYGDDFLGEDDEDDMDEDVGVETKVIDLDENKDGDRRIEGESAEKENEDKGGVSLEPKVEKLKKKRVIKKVVRKDLDKVIVQNKDNLGGDEKNDPMDEEKTNKKEEVEEKGGGSLKKSVKGSRKGGRKMVISGSSAKAATEPNDKLNSKLKKKGGSRRAESMGMIFMCSSKTKQDCYRYHVLGLPAGKRNIVEKIYKGMRLFLYDVDLKLLYGIYKAAGRGGYNIEPKAFNSNFPSQVRLYI